ncbi:MAG: ABC transporter permease subunit [Chloroflexi bacterium]|nr:ABC transporter permease subunit [Chloroflexota bacterium]
MNKSSVLPASSPAQVVQLLPAPISEWTRARRSLVKAKVPILALLILALLALLAVIGPQIAPKDPNRQSLIERLQPPFQQAADGTTPFPLGTDGLGRDVLSRLIYGARVSLAVGLVAVVIGGAIGVFAGILAGYFGGIIDDVIMRLADIQLGFPFILLAIMVLVVLGSGVVNLIIILGVGQWVTYARIARGATMAERERDHITASRMIGATNLHIMRVSVLPNIIAPLIVIASFNVASVILSEASLSFLGLGVPPTVPTWGGMLAESRDQLLGGSWWLAVFPGLCIMFTVLSLNILGDWMRDFLDPRLRGR